MRKPLTYYLEQTYPYYVVPEGDGVFFIGFPDLPGCMTQVEEPAEIAPMAEEIRVLWIETEHERGGDIPEPSLPDGYSGKFVVRIPRSLHRGLAESAHLDGVSLNHYVSTLLARGDAQARIERLLRELTGNVEQDGVGEAIDRTTAPATDTAADPEPATARRSA